MCCVDLPDTPDSDNEPEEREANFLMDVVLPVSFWIFLLTGISCIIVYFSP
jgi:hypothetical protein